MTNGPHNKLFAVFLDVGLVLILVAVLATSYTPVDLAISRWRDDNATKRNIRQQWTQLIADGASLGNKASDITIIEFADYECPFCEQAHTALTRLSHARPDINVIYRHFPLKSIHPHAENAARASICAEQFGIFNRFHNFLYESETWKDDADWSAVAKQFGLSASSFTACLQSDKTSKRLTRDTDLAAALGVEGTPTFISRNGKHVGVLTEQALERLSAR